ncbi:hypothetical protein BJ138DRAFT_974158, partial [Hygrophoropsis aurantiaca]
YYRRHKEGGNPAATACYLLVLILSLICGVAQKNCDFVLATLSFIIRSLVGSRELSAEDRVLLSSIPQDSRSLLNHFDLHPRLRFYVCCPSCFALYDERVRCP